MKDAINPSHYKNEGQPECIELIHRLVQNCTDPFLGFCLGQIKYIYRFGKKDPAKTCEDVKKFIWYTSHYLNNFTEEKLPVKARTLKEAKDIAYYFACDKGDYKNQVYDIVIAVCMLESKDDLRYVVSKLEELVQMIESN